jgi:tRNA threonylcarbamoyladenosine biosynthesis protein TsaE
MKINIDSLDKTKILAEKIAKITKLGDVIELQGDLGAGKTTFARYFINSILGAEEEILSPTFNLVHTYDAKDFTIWHFDLYRLKSENEAEELGIYDAFTNGVCIIEWSQIITRILPKSRLLINLLATDDSREAILTGYGSWQDRVMLL